MILNINVGIVSHHKKNNSDPLFHSVDVNQHDKYDLHTQTWQANCHMFWPFRWIYVRRWIERQHTLAGARCIQFTMYINQIDSYVIELKHCMMSQCDVISLHGHPFWNIISNITLGIDSRSLYTKQIYRQTMSRTNEMNTVLSTSQRLFSEA